MAKVQTFDSGIEIPSVEVKKPWDAIHGFEPDEDIRKAKQEAIDKSGVVPDSIYLPALADSSLLRALKISCFTKCQEDFAKGQLTTVEGLKVVRKSPTTAIDPWEVFVYKDSDNELEILATACVIKNATATRIEITCHYKNP